MKLTIADRISITNFLLPKEATLTEQIVAKDILLKIEISQDEMLAINLKENNGSISWDNSKDPNIEVTFTKAELELLKKGINNMDKEGKVTIQLVDLCIKIQNNEEK